MLAIMFNHVEGTGVSVVVAGTCSLPNVPLGCGLQRRQQRSGDFFLSLIYHTASVPKTTPAASAGENSCSGKEQSCGGHGYPGLASLRHRHRGGGRVLISS